MTQNDLVLSSHPDYPHCVGEGNGHHEPGTARCHVLGVEAVIHTGHGDDAETGSVSGHHEPETARCHALGAEAVIHIGHGDDAETGNVSGVEAERQNGPVLDEAGATDDANMQANAGDDGAPDPVIVTSTMIALVRTPPHDDAAEMLAYMSRAPPSLDGAAQVAAASFPFSSGHLLHVLVSSDPPPSSSNDPAPVSPLPIVDAAPASSPVPHPVSCSAPHAR